VITLKELQSIQQLEQCIKEICPENMRWRMILETERELREPSERDAIAYEIMDDGIGIGLMQYSFQKAGLFHKEKIVIPILTLSEYSKDIVHQTHRYLADTLGTQGELIHVLYSEDEHTPIHHQLKADGFEEKRNPRNQSEYGYEEGSLYFVKKLSRGNV